MEKKIAIFGLTYKFSIHDNLSKAIAAFSEQFADYTLSENEADVIINIEKYTGNFLTLLQNPSLHKTIANGFNVDYGKYQISYQKIDGKIHINLALKEYGKSFKNYLKKINNIQYQGIEERISQIIYENCIYPSIFLQARYSLIHSSGFSYHNKEAILLGGTGGVGKTSIELKISENKKFGFLNDDIAIIKNNGLIYPNTAWPKIYSYNLKNNKRISDIIFKNRNLDDKLAWHFKKIFWGESKVRR